MTNYLLELMQSVQTVQSMQLMQSAITNNQQATPASERSETARSGKSGFNNAPNFSGKWATFPQVGDTIAGYQISSAFGPRKSPCPGCSSMHFGNDVATSMYTPLYAISPLLSLSAKNNQERLEHKTFTKNPDFSHSVRK